jgi:hypothetical protein
MEAAVNRISTQHYFKLICLLPSGGAANAVFTDAPFRILIQPYTIWSDGRLIYIWSIFS